MNNYTIQEATINDIPALIEVFKSSIKAAATQDYTTDQIPEWLRSAKNGKRWTELVEQQIVITLHRNNTIVGFISLKDKKYIDFVYVHGNHQKKGVAQILMDELIKTAKKQGQSTISSDVSYTARPFFEKNGFTVIRQNKNKRGDEVLVNFKMVLTLPTV
ncbi:MAG: GNAT family N-acetyltransferase [Bacteroidetes bacterium]|mgnify:FL=1|jgi:putative acetyltransferase|nr:GNAT family N-acetyltransferase [Bacteroidota bacterium]